MMRTEFGDIRNRKELQNRSFEVIGSIDTDRTSLLNYYAERYDKQDVCRIEYTDNGKSIVDTLIDLEDRIINVTNYLKERDMEAFDIYWQTIPKLILIDNLDNYMTGSDQFMIRAVIRNILSMTSDIGVRLIYSTSAPLWLFDIDFVILRDFESTDYYQVWNQFNFSDIHDIYKIRAGNGFYFQLGEKNPIDFNFECHM